MKGHPLRRQPLSAERSGGPSETRDALDLAAVAKALGHPARIGIVAMLHERQSCIGCDIVEEIGRAQSTTSEHLRILKSAGIITGEIEGPRVCYSLNPAALEPLRRFVDGLAAAPARAQGSAGASG
jgi:ArsR family transcriptional regulator